MYKLTNDEREGIDEYIRLLYKWSEKMNLISPDDRNQILEKHIMPALGMVSLLKSIPHKLILDLGSGAGLPGIPLKIAMPDSTIILVESRRKRANFLKEVVRRLGLKKVEVLNKRIEEQVRPRDERVDIVVARAVAAKEKISNWVGPVLKPSGYIVTTVGEKEQEGFPLLYSFRMAERGRLGVWRA